MLNNEPVESENWADIAERDDKNEPGWSKNVKKASRMHEEECKGGKVSNPSRSNKKKGKSEKAKKDSSQDYSLAEAHFAPSASNHRPDSHFPQRGANHAYIDYDEIGRLISREVCDFSISVVDCLLCKTFDSSKALTKYLKESIIAHLGIEGDRGYLSNCIDSQIKSTFHPLFDGLSHILDALKGKRQQIDFIKNREKPKQYIPETLVDCSKPAQGKNMAGSDKPMIPSTTAPANPPAIDTTGKYVPPSRRDTHPPTVTDASSFNRPVTSSVNVKKEAVVEKENAVSTKDTPVLNPASVTAPAKITVLATACEYSEATNDKEDKFTESVQKSTTTANSDSSAPIVIIKNATETLPSFKTFGKPKFSFSAPKFIPGKAPATVASIARVEDGKEVKETERKEAENKEEEKEKEDIETKSEEKNTTIIEEVKKEEEGETKEEKKEEDEQKTKEEEKKEEEQETKEEEKKEGEEAKVDEEKEEEKVSNDDTPINDQLEEVDPSMTTAVL